ncbi:hypothetical protein E2C01_086416 [Portunus trituberculatus]|uniref:Uncharacterized protein n=1 Tax=Portunus trituberculatus TaxID=210409 RepID=A0A5B7J5C2_PORTR|nr:hypothetical protein [Portunus trituberculatus]
MSNPTSLSLWKCEREDSTCPHASGLFGNAPMSPYYVFTLIRQGVVVVMVVEGGDAGLVCKGSQKATQHRWNSMSESIEESENRYRQDH